MKKLWIVVLALGLVAVFCLPATAVDTKIAGSYVVTGSYEDNREIREDGPSMAFYAQRLRLEPEFKIAEGLFFYTRIDAMTRVWGQNAVGNEHVESSWLNGDTSRYGTNEQNIQFRRGWVQFQVPFGMFLAGYMRDGVLPGQNFGSRPTEGPNILFVTKLGPVVPVIGFEHISEGRLGGGVFPVAEPGNTDSDFTKTYAGGTYYGNWGEIGLYYVYFRNAATRTLPYIPGIVAPFKMEFNWIESHAKFNKGGFYAEYEFVYEWGKYAEFESGVDQKDIDDEGWEAYINLRYIFGPAHVGFMWGYSQGDDPDSYDHEGGILLNGYGVWQPCLILYNDWLDHFAGNLGKGIPANTSNVRELDSEFHNASLYQIYAGYNPTPKLAFKTSFSMVYADEKDLLVGGTVQRAEGDEIGKEFDFQASYKIFDNLEYMLGFAYLWTGDFFRVKDAENNKVDDDYLIIHQLTLSF